MRILSWNVNGLRACTRKGFASWLADCDADIIGLQEVRALHHQIPQEVAAPEGWTTHFTPAERKGYSGVGLYSRRPPDRLDTQLGIPDFDREGRLQIATFGDLLLANVYFPNGGNQNVRVPFKLDFYKALFDHLEDLSNQYDKMIVMGDLNTAHQPVDLARPEANKNNTGFLPEEREELQRWLDAGWIDTFREFVHESGHYTWWSHRQQSRKRNVGWRIDYVLISPGLREHLDNAFILPDVHGSDHCPVGIDLDLDLNDL